MTPVLQISKIAKAFGATIVLTDVTVSIEEGERHAVIGPNGAGKSTLFHLISGHLAPSSGSIRLNGAEISGKSPSKIFAAGIARNFQVNCLFGSMTARENLRCAALHASGYGRTYWRIANKLPGVGDKVGAMLDKIQLGHRADIPCESLSYAEQRALEIGMAVITERSVVLLDEPTAGMSHAETDRFVGLIRNLTQGRTLVVVEHDMGVVFSLADRITVMASGGVVATDTPERIRTNEKVKAAYLGEHAVAQVKEAAPC